MKLTRPTLYQLFETAVIAAAGSYLTLMAGLSTEAAVGFCLTFCCANIASVVFFRNKPSDSESQ